MLLCDLKQHLRAICIVVHQVHVTISLSYPQCQWLALT